VRRPWGSAPANLRPISPAVLRFAVLVRRPGYPLSIAQSSLGFDDGGVATLCDL